jgi:hypothetical protein
MPPFVDFRMAFDESQASSAIEVTGRIIDNPAFLGLIRIAKHAHNHLAVVAGCAICPAYGPEEDSTTDRQHENAVAGFLMLTA